MKILDSLTVKRLQYFEKYDSFINPIDNGINTNEFWNL